MAKKYNYYEEFAKHINYALETFKNDFTPELVNLSSNDKTNEIITLTPYQQFAASLFLLDSYKSMLLFWETGFGKTIECIYIIKNLFNVYPQWKIFLFVKSALANDPWRTTIDKYLPKSIQNKIHMIHYDLQNTENLFLVRHSTINFGERIFYIFDESHDFIKKLLPKENEPERRLSKLIKPLINGMSKSFNKVLFMTATPINDTFKEFIYMMHFLRNGNLKLNAKLFDADQVLLEPELLNLCCLGLVSFKRRSNIDIFKNVDSTPELSGKRINFVNLIMSEYQSSMYRVVSQIELKSKSKGFRTLRKLVNTFAFHDIKSHKDLDEEEYNKLLKEKASLFNSYMNSFKLSEGFLQHFESGTIETMDDTILSKNLNFISKPVVSLSSSLSSKSSVFEQDLSNLRTLHSYSSKYVKTCQIIKQSPGKCVVYQPFVKFEGVETILSYFKQFNISYIVYTQNTRNERSKLIETFNNKNNSHGEQIKCCVFSSAGTEGISLLNIRDLIIMDIPWSGSLLEQIFGRAIRLHSHKDLPENERMVEIHILMNYSNDNKYSSVDEEILNIIKQKETQKTQLMSVMKSSSIETIYEKHPYAEPVTKDSVNFYALTNVKYDLESYTKQHVSVLIQTIPINYTFSPAFENVFEDGFLNEDTNEVFSDSVLIGKLFLDKNNKKTFKIINNKLVYLIIV